MVRILAQDDHAYGVERCQLECGVHILWRRKDDRAARETSSCKRDKHVRTFEIVDEKLAHTSGQLFFQELF